MLAISKHCLKPSPPSVSPSNNTDQPSHRDGKCNPATPEGGKSKDTSKQLNKRGKTTVAKPSNIVKNEMGIFYLRNPNAHILNVFPKYIADKICADFTCEGKECTREPCLFMHPCNPRQMDKATVEAIA